MTDVSAVRLQAPDLAAGDLFGSSMANMLILAFINLLPAGAGIFRKAVLDHALYAALAILLTAIAAVAILLRPSVSALGLGPGSIAIVLVYLAGSRAIFRHSVVAREAGTTAEMGGAANGQAAMPTAPASPQKRKTRDDADAGGRAPRGWAAISPVWRAAISFAVASAVILVAAPAFARAAEEVAVVTGVGDTVVGTWLVGFATSLPELVTSLAAVRLGAFDLAVGNLFGSNAFNMMIIPLLDFAQGGPFLGVISPVHAISAISAIALMAVAIAALVYRAASRFHLLEPSSAIIIAGYVLGLAAVLLATMQ
jgi:cation:H+ antiporter